MKKMPLILFILVCIGCKHWPRHKDANEAHKVQPVMNKIDAQDSLTILYNIREIASLYLGYDSMRNRIYPGQLEHAWKKKLGDIEIWYLGDLDILRSYTVFYIKEHRYNGLATYFYVDDFGDTSKNMSLLNLITNNIDYFNKYQLDNDTVLNNIETFFGLTLLAPLHISHSSGGSEVFPPLYFINLKNLSYINNDSDLEKFVRILKTDSLPKIIPSDDNDLDYYHRYIKSKYYNESANNVYQHSKKEVVLITKMNKSFLLTQVYKMKKDIARKKVFYIYSTPDLALYRVGIIPGYNNGSSTGIKFTYMYVNEKYKWRGIVGPSYSDW